MRSWLAILVLAALGACARPSPTPEAAASEPALLGEYRAASDNACKQTGDVAIERGGLVFAKGVILYTRALRPRRGYDLVAAEGNSFAAIALGPAGLSVDLRRVTEQTLSGGAEGLCGADAPTYIALAYEERAASVTMMVFAGEEPPGSGATQSRLCGAFAYAAPDGARTRQGVVWQ
jgi:hypothetical protein